MLLYACVLRGLSQNRLPVVPLQVSGRGPAARAVLERVYPHFIVLDKFTVEFWHVFAANST